MERTGTGRTVAESAKSVTWKLLCGAEPFRLELGPRRLLRDSLMRCKNCSTRTSNSRLRSVVQNPAREQVTAFMSGLRESATGVRRDVYLSQRVNEQQAWYARKSAVNRKHRNVWFTLLVIFQAAAGAAAVILAINPTFQWRATAVFRTLASATVAWGRIKRYQELAQAYGLAAQELSLIAARGPFIGNPEELARFVNDAETAISREHAMWVARRETK